LRIRYQAVHPRLPLAHQNLLVLTTLAVIGMTGTARSARAD
jgi:hypothetical protein